MISSFLNLKPIKEELKLIDLDSPNPAFRHSEPIRNVLGLLCDRENELVSILDSFPKDRKLLNTKEKKYQKNVQIVLDGIIKKITGLIDIASQLHQEEQGLVPATLKNKKPEIPPLHLTRSSRALEREKELIASGDIPRHERDPEIVEIIEKDPLNEFDDNDMIFIDTPIDKKQAYSHAESKENFLEIPNRFSCKGDPTLSHPDKAIDDKDFLLGSDSDSNENHSHPSKKGTSKNPSKSDKNWGPTEIPPEEIIFDKKKDSIGSGAFGTVYKATCRGKTVAVKVPVRQHLSEVELKAFRHEVDILRKIYHPNVVLFLGACTKPGNLMIVTELMATDVDRLLHTDQKKVIPMYTKLKMARDAVLGINWLHGINKIIHRDLKPANLLVDSLGNVKVTDFGFSKILRDKKLCDRRGPKGTALYMAPEVMRLEPFDERSDVYSFGLILYELISEQEPFSEYQQLEPFFQAVCFDMERPIVPDFCPPSLRKLIHRCWDPDPAMRPLFPEILNIINSCIVDNVISFSPPAASFWKSHFLKDELLEEIPWKQFETALSKSLKIAPPVLKGLRDIIATPPNSNVITEGYPFLVTMKRFHLFACWFGEFFNEEQGMLLVKEIIEIFSYRWFYSDIPRTTCENWLQKRPEGTFLVRLSLADPVNCPFTLSKVKLNKISHKRVYRVSYDYGASYRYNVIANEKEFNFSSLCDMISYLREIRNIGSICPGMVVIPPQDVSAYEFDTFRSQTRRQISVNNLKNQ